MSAWERPKTADGALSPKAKRPSTSRNVSFQSGGRPVASRNVSFQNGPRPGQDEVSELPASTPRPFMKETQNKRWQRVDRHSQNMDP